MNFLVDIDIRSPDNEKLTVMSATKNKSNCKRLYSIEMEEIKKILADKKYVCTTADTYSTRTKRCVGVTAHWVCENINYIIFEYLF